MRVERGIAGLLLGLGLLLPGASAQAGAGGLAARPPMGWNSWNHFAEHVTDADIRTAADQLVSTGMRDAGYVYVNLDDTWQGERDAKGVLHPNARFPDMKALADYVHSKGLKFGIYSSPGEKTCGGYAGSLGHEAEDAKMYAAWGVDYLKYDLCSMQDTMRAARQAHPDDPDVANRMMREAYRKMGEALRATGRPILYSLCQYGLDEVWKWGPGVGAQMWRTTDDIDSHYPRMAIIALEQAGLDGFAGPGHWNDPDMLEVGNGGMTADEDRTHMGLWVMLAAPLLAGNDLSRMSPEAKATLMNREAIAIDQDPLGKQAARVYQHGDLSVWARPLVDGRMAVLLWNGAGDTREVPVDLKGLGFQNGAMLHDVWQQAGQQGLGRKTGVYTRNVPKHSGLLLILSR